MNIFEIILIAILLFATGVNIGILFYCRGEVFKLRLLLCEQRKTEENEKKIPIDEQWSNFLSYDGGRDKN